MKSSDPFGASAALSRRGFLLGAGAFAALPSIGDPEPPLRVLVASDIHYRPGVFPHDNREWLERIVARGVSEKVDFGIQLGDFVHNAARDRDFIDAWRKAAFPTWSVIGNHDDDATTPAKTREALGLERGHYRFDCKGWRFLVLDTNHAFVNGKFVHYGASCGFTYYKLPKADRMRLTPEQLEWLKGELDGSPFPCVICSHVRLDDSGADSAAVMKLVTAANAAHPGRVRLMMNGHNHCDRFDVTGGVAHWTVNSANHVWVARKHTAYPAEDVVRWKGIDHVIAYDTPLCAVLELGRHGSIAIRGMKGRFWRDIEPRQAGFTKSSATASIADREMRN